MTTKSFFLTLCLLTSTLTSFAQSSVVLGEQVMTESAIESGKAYILRHGGNGTAMPYIEDKGTYYAVPNSQNSPTTACVYRLYSNGNGTWTIKNIDTNKCWGIPVYGTELQPASDPEAGMWSLNFSGGIAYPTAPDAQGTVRGLDRSSQRLWGYTTGTGNTKKVMIYEIAEKPLSSTPLEELVNYTVEVASEPAADLTTGQWYVMFDRGYTGKNPHGYLYEKAETHTLYNTATLPSGLAKTAARYLVRLSDAGDGNYYVQTGFGNYFGAFAQATVVPVTSTPKEAITIQKIASTDGHFYLQCASTGTILDANDLSQGDATVVGWGSTTPTSIGGNNDWAFYPVTLQELDPAIALFEENISVIQGYQTTGRGNEALLLRIDITPSQAMSKATLTLALDAVTQQNISQLSIYETTQTEFLANKPAAPITTTDAIGSTATLTLNDIAEGTHHYWLCATVKDDATLGAILDAALTTISYTTSADMTLDVTSIGNPARQGAKVFELQRFVFKPTSDDCRFYRIPAMMLDKDGNIVIAADKRYNSNSDLGNHKIDVVSMRSEDGGLTWKDKADIAIGDGSTAAYFGYGDAALARAVNGDLVCIMASGSKMWSTGMVTAGLARSTDNGKSWTLVKNFLKSSYFYDENNANGSLSVNNFFTTSGKGLTTNDGIIMFTTNCRNENYGNTNLIYVLYSTDNGQTWRHSKALAYSGGDESKLEQLNDGSLLLSVRQSGNRGWNTATYTKNDDGTVTFNWGTQYRTSDIWGNACNADILYYSRKTNRQPDIMLHSFINSSGRESLQLSMSLDSGKTWKGVQNIQLNGSCYSTMITLPNGNVALLFEDSSYDAGNGYAINYLTITREQILGWFVDLGGELPVIEPGDVNGDGNVDLTDAIMIVYHSLGQSPSGFNEEVADLNGDGKIDLTDAIIVVYKSLQAE